MDMNNFFYRVRNVDERAYIFHRERETGRRACLYISHLDMSSIRDRPTNPEIKNELHEHKNPTHSVQQRH